jgi:hypothetical protein
MAAGCGGKAGTKPPAAVKGRVLRNGEPLARSVVLTFYPLEEESGIKGTASAVTAENDGSFSVECVPGTYKVTISPIPTGRGNPAGGNKTPAPGAPKPLEGEFSGGYLSANSTPLQAVVPEGGTENLELQIP